MSTAEESFDWVEEEPEYPKARLPIFPTEVVQARQEDPEFGEVLGRARAKALQVEYDPVLHYPFRPAGKSHDRVTPESARKLERLMWEWEGRARNGTRHMRLYR